FTNRRDSRRRRRAWWCRPTLREYRREHDVGREDAPVVVPALGHDDRGRLCSERIADELDERLARARRVGPCVMADGDESNPPSGSTSTWLNRYVVGRSASCFLSCASDRCAG